VNPDIRNVLAALVAFLLGVAALRTLGQMAAGHALHLVRRHSIRRRHRRR
jgi:hypothetical protein